MLFDISDLVARQLIYHCQQQVISRWEATSRPVFMCRITGCDKGKERASSKVFSFCALLWKARHKSLGDALEMWKPSEKGAPDSYDTTSSSRFLEFLQSCVGETVCFSPYFRGVRRADFIETATVCSLVPHLNETRRETFHVFPEPCLCGGSPMDCTRLLTFEKYS